MSIITITTTNEWTPPGHVNAAVGDHHLGVPAFRVLHAERTHDLHRISCRACQHILAELAELGFHQGGDEPKPERPDWQSLWGEDPF